ncbi:sensor histidine kinase [Chryseobacterium indologenes]|uniref:histidine kinase n=1 Tax=Chryseobacterium indologenes TaxID=253 RepID=A0A0N0IU27_CHRID|nr:ATP-binding protein [Chryseobacterium indologenes]KPE49234.1 histidine kinase [Chryseobacterium indologenes]
MKLRTKYIIFMVALHLVCLVMSYFIFESHKLLFILAEAVILVSIVISLNLYKQLINPLIYLKQGVNAIKDQDFNVKFLATGQKEIDELVDVYNRMIDELRTERTKQQEQHFFLEKLIQTSPTGIVILDYDGEVKQINPKAEEIISVSSDLLEQLKSLQIGAAKIIRIGGLRSYKVQKSKFIDRGFERVFMMIAEVTAEIFEAEKNVYSKVIRMMAHEVNNTVGPVNSIMNSVLAHQQNNPVKSDQLLNNALQVAIDRNQNLNIFMRNFADLVKLPEANKKQVDLISLVKSLYELMLFSAKEKQVKIELVLPDEPYYIQADAQLLEQALINIVKNAMEAIELQGLITITLNPIEHQLIITDNGGGIAKGHAEQLFSPFFSTKKDGQGIGLTLVREILLNHGFEFSLNTESGLTKFSIVL